MEGFPSCYSSKPYKECIHTSKAFKTGTVSNKVSYIFLLLKAVFSTILLNVCRSCKIHIKYNFACKILLTLILSNQKLREISIFQKVNVVIDDSIS